MGKDTAASLLEAFKKNTQRLALEHNKKRRAAILAALDVARREAPKLGISADSLNSIEKPTRGKA